MSAKGTSMIFWVASFLASQTKDHVRTIYEATVRRQRKTMKWSLNSTATAFCIIKCGSIDSQLLLEISNGKRPVHDFLQLYEVKDRNEYRETAPASGLLSWRKYIMNKIWLDFLRFIMKVIIENLYLKNRNIVVFGICFAHSWPVNLIVCQTCLYIVKWMK